MKIKNMTTLHFRKSIGRSLLWRCGFVLVPLALVCFGLSPTAKALLPAPSPDGGYPGGNTAEGINALHDINTAVGINNTAVGANALTHDTTGSLNTAIGADAMRENTIGENNTAIGADALSSNIDGTDNNAVGDSALANNTTGNFNEALGSFALGSNIEGFGNVAIGDRALNNAVSGFNTVVGFDAGQNLAAGAENIYLGDTAGTLDFIGASPGDEVGVIRIGSVFSGAAACFINGIATNSQVWNGVTVCQVTVNGFGQLGVDCVNPNNPGATPASPGAPVLHSATQPHARPQHQAMLNDKVEKLQATVAQQQKQIATLTAQLKEQAAQFTAQLKEQAAQIQKVSAELEVSKPAPE